MNGEAGKGDRYRKVDKKIFDENYERIFSKAPKKLFICYMDNGYDGYTEPKAVFLYEPDAINWCNEQRGSYTGCREYTIMTLHENGVQYV